MKKIKLLCLTLIVIFLPSCHGCYEISYDDYNFQKRKDKNYYHPLLRYDGYYIEQTQPINFYKKRCDTCKEEVYFAIGYKGFQSFKNGIYFMTAYTENINDILTGNINGYYGYYHIENNNLYLENIRYCYLTRKVKNVARYEIFSDRIEKRYVAINVMDLFGDFNLKRIANKDDKYPIDRIFKFYKVEEQYLDTLKQLEELNFH